MIYPGSYVQISPAFVFRDVTFIDSDKNAKKFFEDNSTLDYISKRKEYEDKSHIAFHARDYAEIMDELRITADLLISQYAGFISDTCKDYLKIGGYLLVNNSHADAGLASIDEDYDLVATASKSGGQYHISTDYLSDYFIPKKDIFITKKYLYKLGKGVGYTKTAPLYIFQRIS